MTFVVPACAIVCASPLQTIPLHSGQESPSGAPPRTTAAEHAANVAELQARMAANG